MFASRMARPPRPERPRREPNQAPTPHVEDDASDSNAIRWSSNNYHARRHTPTAKSPGAGNFRARGGDLGRWRELETSAQVGATELLDDGRRRLVDRSAPHAPGVAVARVLPPAPDGDLHQRHLRAMRRAVAVQKTRRRGVDDAVVWRAGVQAFSPSPSSTPRPSSQQSEQGHRVPRGRGAVIRAR